ncbi:hypothetical protein ACEWY4_020229 [Coilia grayii]|uniref:Uncharacterized protein n=1 Tax=Coilia grayii TaxID=363190 RepID=A0ABD1JF72_9TELE
MSALMRHVTWSCVSGVARVKAVALTALLFLFHTSTSTKQQQQQQQQQQQHGAQDKPHPHPCMAAGGHVYNTFLKRHLPPNQPTTEDQNEWTRFIEGHRLCGRPTQSFLHPNDKQQVDGVCSPDGGRTVRENLCISTQKFSFFTVRMRKNNNCQVHKVKQEFKHIILGCSKVNNTCRPVHFEGNPDGKEPSPDQPPCEWRQSSGAKMATAAGASVLLTLGLPLLLGY